MKLGTPRVLALYEGIGPGRTKGQVRLIAATGEPQLHAAAIAVVEERAAAGMYGRNVGAALAIVEAKDGDAAYRWLLGRRTELGEFFELKFIEEP